MLIKKIADKSLELRKLRDPIAVFYTTILSDTKMLGKNEGNREPTDDDALRIIRKYLKSNDDTINLCKENNVSVIPEKVLVEREVLLSLLPQVASDEEMITVINSTLGNGPVDIKQMGRVMAALKTEFKTSLDPKRASDLVRGILTVK